METTKEIYLDYAAATPLDPRVREAMEPYLGEEFGNPSGLYARARRTKDAIEAARSTVAQILHARAGEIIFTGSGTESINLALFGVARRYQKEGKHVITSKIEHLAVLRSCEALEKEGFEVTYLDVDQYGTVAPEAVQRALRPETVLVSIMYANNEIGTIEPIAEISKVIQEPFFHVDACQAGAALDLNLEMLGVDLFTLNGSKIYGPKGIGILFVRKGTQLEPIIHGGGQENGIRSGTENVAAIVGFAKALEIAQDERQKESERLTKLRDFFISELIKRIPETVLNGHPTNRLPNNINISIPDIEADAAVLFLDAKGISVSTGSACSAVSLDPSHVIVALGRQENFAFGSLRFSLGRGTTRDDLLRVLEVLPGVVQKVTKS